MWSADKEVAAMTCQVALDRKWLIKNLVNCELCFPRQVFFSRL